MCAGRVPKSPVFASIACKMASPQPQVTGEQLVAATPEKNKTYLRMGKLSKRQRGMHHPNTRNLKFQERWFVLNQAALEYYEKDDDVNKNPKKV